MRVLNTRTLIHYIARRGLAEGFFDEPAVGAVRLREGSIGAIHNWLTGDDSHLHYRATKRNDRIFSLFDGNKNISKRSDPEKNGEFNRARIERAAAAMIQDPKVRGALGHVVRDGIRRLGSPIVVTEMPGGQLIPTAHHKFDLAAQDKVSAEYRVKHKSAATWKKSHEREYLIMMHKLYGLRNTPRNPWFLNMTPHLLKAGGVAHVAECVSVDIKKRLNRHLRRL